MSRLRKDESIELIKNQFMPLSSNLADDAAEPAVGAVTAVFAPTFCNDSEKETFLKIKGDESTIDVGGKGAILKQVLTAAPEGAEVCPNSEANVTVHYEGKLLDGTIFDSSFARGEPFSFDIGNSQVIRGWDEGVAGMRIGEKALLTICSDYAYGSSGSGKIPADATLQFTVELIDFTEKDHEYPLENDKKIECAKVRQAKGNDLFKAEQYAKAAAKYEKGTQLLENLFEAPENMDKERYLLRATLFGNWALTLSKLGDHVGCIDKARSALDLLDDNYDLSAANKELYSKCLARMGKACFAIADFQRATKCFEMIVSLWGETDSAAGAAEVAKARKDIERCAAKVREYKQKQAELYKKMMGGCKTVGSYPAKPAAEPHGCDCGDAHCHEGAEKANDADKAGCGCNDDTCAEKA